MGKQIMEKHQCKMCGNYRKKFIEHHLSYYPEEKIIVCTFCHRTIHTQKQFTNLIPLEYHKKIFYSTKDCMRNSKGFIIRDLTKEERELKYQYKKYNHWQGVKNVI